MKYIICVIRLILVQGVSNWYRGKKEIEIYSYIGAASLTV